MLTQVVTYLYEDEYETLRERLLGSPYPIKYNPKASIVISVKTPQLSLKLYHTGKLVIQGKDTEVVMMGYVEDLVSARYTITSIGTDESGKGDYFGPLVVAAVRLGRFDVEPLLRLSVQDSKVMSDASVVDVAEKLVEILPHRILVIGNPRYNELYSRMGNLNRILIWAHAKVAEALFQEANPQRLIVDRFTNPALLQRRLKGHSIDLIQVERGERELPVAAASVLARAEFLRRLRSISKRFNLPLPKGAGEPAVAAAYKFIRRFGEERLSEVAKLHFKTTQKVLNLR